MLKELAFALFLPLVACNAPTSIATADQRRITPDSNKASHCYAAHNFELELANRQNPPPLVTAHPRPEPLDVTVRALWQERKFGPLAPRQVAEEQVIALSKQMVREPETAVVLARQCSRIEDRDPAFHRARGQIINELSKPPPTTPIT